MTSWRERSPGNLHPSPKLHKHKKTHTFPTLTTRFELISRLITSFETSSERTRALKWKILLLMKDDCFRIIYSAFVCVPTCTCAFISKRNHVFINHNELPIVSVCHEQLFCLPVSTDCCCLCRFFSSCVCVCLSVCVHVCPIHTVFNPVCVVSVLSLTSPGKPCPLRRCSEPWESSLPKWRRTSSSL